MQLTGIHHISSLTANAEQNLHFYTNILGLRLVKKTVNQDNTSNYHLFYGDEKGSPGTELTFFEIPNLAVNHPGTNSISNISLRVASNKALTFWKNRFEQFNVDHDEITNQFHNAVLSFRDPEGHRMTLVSDEHDKGLIGGKPWSNKDIPEEFAIIGLGPVTLTVRYYEPTFQVLTDLMGYRAVGSYSSNNNPDSIIHVLETGQGGNGTAIHLEERKDLPEERQGRGGVHHVAFRVQTEEELKQWVAHIEEDGFQSSGFIDRYYFRSLYFREPNGILFELATDGPGFMIDESLEHLGEQLSLPPFLEAQRHQIVAKLKPLPTK
ncbi:ring-cleaving dioxygenase [Virgibacillus sp. LDC-1]|uniref:ring-cleaving dioxygenase n=1 Tax=Virgibacillus sp. LDC-1 TaxID=3039856 RepID=UPI0024DECADB|nr:ring-cleaving dioxygenase [Virgibacillus sp. LDC-1]